MKPIIILPTYNEALNVEKMINKIFNEVFKNQQADVLIVDSNSPDGTANIAEKLQEKYKNLHLLKQEKKLGLANAYIEGFKWALKGDYDTFIQMDCDFQHPVEILPDCIEKTKEYDLVISSRYVKDGHWSKDTNKNRTNLSCLGNIYAKTILNCPINDLTGGFNIWTKKALSSIDLDKIISKGYSFQIEMKYKCFKNNMKILEYPFTFNKREYGESKINKKIMLEALIKIWKIRFSK